MGEGAYRDAGAAIERVAVLEAEAEALRAELATLRAELAQATSTEKPYDDRDVRIRRLEQERDALKKRIGKDHAKQTEAQQRALDEAHAAAEALRSERALLEKQMQKLETRVRELEPSRELERERDALREELTALRPFVRGENETAYLRRLTEERDELAAEVRALRKRR